MRLSWKQQANRERDIPHFLALLSLYRFAYRSGRRRARLHGRSPFAESNGNTTPCYREECHRRFEGNGDETPGPDKGLLRKAPELLDTAFDAHGPDGLLGDSYRRIYFILFFFPPAHNLRPFWLFPLMQILQPRPDPAYVLRHSGARRDLQKREQPVKVVGGWEETINPPARISS